MKPVCLYSLVGMCLLYGNTAIAGGSDYNCRRYANEAHEAAVANAEILMCGFAGPRWSYQWDEHYKWCMRTNWDVVWSEWTQRKKQIKDCENVENDCLAYSNTAVSQQWHHCTGPRWSYDRAAHEGWCLRVSPQLRREETKARGRRNC
jgi:hypothetical protein